MLEGKIGTISGLGAVVLSFLLMSSGLAWSSQRQKAETVGTAPWVLRADWNRGISGWMSFPLAQDVGYDPSLYTEQRGNSSVLVHTFRSYGQSRVWFGLVRPVKFRADAGARIEIEYRLENAGSMGDLQLILAGENGHQYSATIPSGNGDHSVQISASALHLTGLVKVNAIVLRGRLEDPPAGSESRWILERFVLDALRPKQVALSLPHMAASVNGALVAREIVAPGGALHIELESVGSRADVALYDPAGGRAENLTFAPGQREVAIPLGIHAKPGLWRAEVTRGNAKTIFRFLVLGAAPAHGNLLLSEQRLDQLSRSPQYAGLRQEIHHRAQLLAGKIHYSKAAGDNIASMPSGPGIEGAAPDELLPYLELMENYANAIAFNALDYRLNKNKAALDSARRALLAMASWKAWSPPRFTSHGLHTYYEVGCAAQRVAFGYDLIANELSQQDKALVAHAFWAHAIEPVVREYFLDNRDPIAASNWMANSVGGALAAAVAVDGDVPGWNQREGPAVAELEFAYQQLLQGLFPGDGSEAEPTGYENFAMKGLSWGMSALARLGIQTQGAHRMLEGFWWVYYDTVRPGTELDTGDFDGHLKALTGFAWGAEHGHIPELRALYDQGGTSPDLSHGASAALNGQYLEELAGPLDLVCCSGPAPKFDPPPPSRVFPKRGSAVLRSGWGPNATVISLRAGPWFNHEHEDEGSFQIAAWGRRLVTEEGFASYYTDPHYQTYFSQAAGHNVVLIDGDPFSQAALNGRYWAAFKHPYISAWLLSPSFDYLSANLTSAYDGRLGKYERDFFFLKPDILVVLDRLSAPRAHQFSWLLHTPSGSEIHIDHGHASFQLSGVGAGAVLTAVGANKAFTVKTAPVKMLRYKILDGPRIEPQKVLQLHSGKVDETRFLVGIKVENGPRSMPPHALEACTVGAGEGLRNPEGEPAGLVVRTGTGPLEACGDSNQSKASLSTDGSVLAWRGRESQDWMTIGARRVEEGGHAVFHATKPTDISWESSSQGLTLEVHNAAPDSIEVFLPTAAATIEVDGHRVPSSGHGGMVSLPALSPGEHHISIH